MKHSRVIEGLCRDCRINPVFLNSPLCSGCRDKQKERLIKWKFGLTPEAFAGILEFQGGLCAICAKPFEERPVKGKSPIHIDHNHETGEVRGLLCFGCNHGLGGFKDNPSNLEAAIKYLREPISRRVNNSRDNVK